MKTIKWKMLTMVGCIALVFSLGLCDTTFAADAAKPPVIKKSAVKPNIIKKKLAEGKPVFGVNVQDFSI